MADRTFWLALAAACAMSTSARAEIRALVVGIDRYQHISSLEGAVADAEDIAGSLTQLGVTDLTLVRDGEADRAALERAWEAIVDRASPGDQLILTYAGHGAQLPETVGGSEADGMDEFLVLPGFDVAGSASLERLVDDELNRWFKMAEAKGARVLAAVDACHSGTAFRKLDQPAAEVRYRYVELPAGTVLEEIPTDARMRSIGRDELDNLTFISGAQDDQTVPELIIPDKAGLPEKRGAMSWSLARALEGAADSDRDGLLRRGELYDFVERKVRALADARQTPSFWPPAARDAGLVRLSAEPQADGTMAADGPMRLAIIRGTPSTASMMQQRLRHTELVAHAADAELIWDARSGEVVGALGDVLAVDIRPDNLQPVIDKHLALRMLKLSVQAQPLKTQVLPDDGTHLAGSRVGLSIDGIGQPFLTLVNLANNGTVQFLFPVDADPDVVQVGRPFELGPIDVVAPFGADHLVALATPDAPEELRARLRSLDQQPAALEAGRAIMENIGRQHAQIGILGIFTAAR
ncbi:MAG TPA: caspase family protein [Geminicoccus sp.]|uniref:caspase family protein n=1 Tax=Geminicoccus sp. TaxID=2024832 RepID=UPI002E367B9D|nr:caspase family protein [Geminicoccus sp.]HEX2528858.1 caspase family protein [Geminicoccus sp.]